MMIRMYKSKIQTMKEKIFKDSNSLDECREKALSLYSEDELRSYLAYECGKKWRKTTKEYYEAQSNFPLDEIVKMILGDGAKRFWIKFELESTEVVTVKENDYLSLKSRSFLHALMCDKTKAYDIYSSLFESIPEFLEYDDRVMTEERMDHLINDGYIELIKNDIYKVKKDFEVVVSINKWTYCGVRGNYSFEVTDGPSLWEYIKYCIEED